MKFFVVTIYGKEDHMCDVTEGDCDSISDLIEKINKTQRVYNNYQIFSDRPFRFENRLYNHVALQR